ncbi:ABC transporter substrate-binding protein [Acinetobacter indicus]|uniref:ABC transporter substrate-binding protein n=1 Tax=Acinetobacter indicus TaxID=756892 RepID=UPI00197B649F|nr:ABC transporter substrate-binding protein [Acinetobacter indicus]QSG83346.1 ABC transporter substrate-binding protein [Acinetobacter indicus]
MHNLEKTKLQIGYIPLLDCVAILWAKQRGFFADAGLNVELLKEPSWASLRDRLAFGFMDAAHCLSAMLPAAALGTDQLGIPLQTPLVLSTNQAYISLSQSLCFELGIQSEDDAAHIATKLINAHQQRPIQLAHVFHTSIHHYCLREWLALADPILAKNIQLSTLPPPYMVEAISQQQIDGFCVGEPWNTQAELQGYSKILLSGQQVIPQVADKVLAVTAEWAAQHPNTLNAMTSAIQRAQAELHQLEDVQAVWQMLNEAGIIQFPCSAQVHVERYYFIQNIIRSLVDESSAQPQAQDFVWLTEQMLKWDSLDVPEVESSAVSQRCIYPLPSGHAE